MASSSDTVRILTGVGAIAIASAAVVFVLTNKPGQDPPDATPSQSVLTSAIASGVDISRVTPQQDFDRLKAAHAAGDTTRFEEVEFRNRLYFEKPGDGAERSSVTFSGYLVREHADGSARTVCCVVDGTVQGPFMEAHPDGSMKRIGGYKDGAPVSQWMEFFPTGDLKLRAMVYGDSPNGGSVVGEITVGTYSDGTYSRDELGSGRLQFIADGKPTQFSTKDVSVGDIDAWMLFTDGLMGGQKVWTTDSREVEAPASTD